MIIATPTGSTAYAFSAGGPVVWPDVEAILLVPNSAHALFARPIVVGPTSRLAVEVIPHAEGLGVMWCDGRRPVDLRPGSRIDVRRSAVPMRLARRANLERAQLLLESSSRRALQARQWHGPQPHPLSGIQSPRPQAPCGWSLRPERVAA